MKHFIPNSNNKLRFKLSSRFVIFLVLLVAFIPLFVPVRNYASDSTPTQTPILTLESNTKAYIRFEVHQQALIDLVGTLTVKGADYSVNTPLSARAGEKINSFVMITEHTGNYRMELILSGKNTPALWVEGEIQKVSEGEYKHRLIGADADPAVFVLAPEEQGVIIAIGSVQGHLEAKVRLVEPSSGLLEIGADANADGNIDPSGEIVSLTLNEKSDASLATAEKVLPLTGKYIARFTAGGGAGVMAYNQGVYDFLNRQGVTVDKDAKSEMVSYFSVSFIRMPIATSVTILNASIHPPSVTVHVEPKKTEYTEDIIRHDNSENTSVTPAAAIASDQNPDVTTIANNAPVTPAVVNAASSSFGKFMLANWVWITLGGAIFVAVILLVRRPTVQKRE